MSSLPDVDVDDWLIDEDEHAHVRYFKLIEVAYNCARYEHYATANLVLRAAQRHYEEAEVADD